MKIHNLVDGMTVGGLTCLIFPILSWQAWAVIIAWALLSAAAESYDAR